MKKLFNIKKLYIKILVIIFGIYVISVLINQQAKLNGYKESQTYYQKKAEQATEYQEELINMLGFEEYCRQIEQKTKKIKTK